MRLHLEPSGTLQKDTQLNVNSYKSGAQPDRSTEDVAPAGLSPAECLECILPYSHEYSSQNSAFPSTDSVQRMQRIHCTIGKARVRLSRDTMLTYSVYVLYVPVHVCFYSARVCVSLYETWPSVSSDTLCAN